VAGGCGGFGSSKTIAKTGAVGATFSGPGGLRVQLVRYLPRVAPPRKDVTGLATPKDGTHFVAFLVRMCITTSYLPTLSERNFTVPLAGGGAALRKFPQTVLADDLNLLGEPGCERGYVVFQVPRRRRARGLHFALSFTKSDPNGYSDGTNVRFAWTLPAA
jgi:hypothetical protein